MLSFQPFGAPAADSVEVRVEPEASGWLGRVVIAGTPTLEREVRGERCEDVVAALALITVLRLEASEASAAASSASRSEGASASAPSAASGEAPSSPVQGEALGPGRAAEDERNPSRASGAEATRAPSPALPVRPATPAASGGRAASEAQPTAPVPAEREPADASQEASDAELERDAARGADARASENPAPDVAPPEPIARAPDVESEPSATSIREDEPAPDSDEGVEANEPERASEPWRWPAIRAGVAAEVGYATVPEKAPFGRIEAELRFGEDMSSWATALALAYARSTSEVRTELGTTPVSAELGITLLTAELALCPPAIDTTSIWFRVCAGVRGGSVHVLITPDDASLGTGDTWRPWIALAPALQVGVPLSERWAIRGVFELAMQLVRDRFGVWRTIGVEQEPITLYRPGAVSFEFSLGLGYTF
jgi:hypothetical protein